MVKPAFGQPIDAKTLQATIEFFENNMKILHPFMPFITEEVWQTLGKRSVNEALIVSRYPVKEQFDARIISDFEIVKEIVSGIRNIRKDKNISFKNSIDLAIINSDKFTTNYNAVIAKMGNVSQIDYVDKKVEKALSFRVRSNEYYIPMGDAVDVEAEKTKLEEELKYTQGFLKSVQGKLSNKRFVDNAPEQVVAVERKKEAEALAKIAALETSIAGL